MAKNITASGAQVIASAGRGVLITVNAALTGTIITTVAGSTQYGTAAQTIGTVTNPTVGSMFRYGGLRNQGAISVNPSATCDITVSLINGNV